MKKEIDQVKSEYDLLQQKVIRLLTNENVDQMRIDGALVYLHVIKVAAPVVTSDREALAARLASNDDTKWLVRPTYNANSLSAWARGLEIDDETLKPKIPPHLVGFMEVKDLISARVRGK
jgi:hypothetical protein